MTIEELEALTADNPKIWTIAQAERLYGAPFNDLLHVAHGVHRKHFNPNMVQLSTLLNIKTGGCPEDCAYCPQSAHYNTGVTASPALAVADVVTAARTARAAGATRFCMGAAWRRPRDRDLDQVCDMVAAVKAEGMETCVTIGMLTAPQAERLHDAGLDYYNHNIDTSSEYYEKIISTRTYADRIETLGHVRRAGLRVCCGGIVGMGEAPRDRVAMLVELASLAEPPESVPINMLVRVPGTPLANAPPIDTIEFVRTIAIARILLPRSYVRLSAGRSDLSRAEQALCFFAGANSIFYGDRLLTTDNPDADVDTRLFADLGLRVATTPLV